MKCKYFDLRELVPPEIYKERGERAWELLSPALLLTLDTLHSFFGPIIINNWATGGTYRDSGFRSFSSPVGATYSNHKFGRAADCKPKTCTPQEMYAKILEAPSKFMHITTMEDINKTPSWVHVAVANSEHMGILIVEPSLTSSALIQSKDT